MSTLKRDLQVSLLDDRINILDRYTTEASPLKKVFTTVGAILALVRDEMIANDDTVQLSGYCFGVCEALKATTYGDAGDLDRFATMALDDLGSVICEIERVLRRRASMPGLEYDKSKFGGHKLQIQRILDALNAPTSSLNRDGDAGELGLQSLSLDFRDAAMASASENAFERLIRREFTSDELPSLLEETFAYKDVDDTIRRLPRDAAQTLVDVMDEALDRLELSLWARVKCLRRLYRTCGCHGILPKALKIPVCYDHTVYPLYRGGYADVWKGDHCGREVAVKVIRMYSKSDVQKILGRFCKEVVTWKSLQHQNVLSLTGVTVSEDQFAMISDWMSNGNINEFVKANPDANKLRLLEDVARGLVYIHHRGMIHGDLKGANILIDQTGHARLADFGLLTIASDPATLLPQSSYAQGGTMRWMSPEILAPGEYGFETTHPTKSSDCYSLGMVIYETISGNVPFYEVSDMAVFLKVVKGERPRRGAGFTDDLWEMMEQCWMPRPDDRPSVEGVLHRLEMSSNPTSPTAPPSPNLSRSQPAPSESTIGPSQYLPPPIPPRHGSTSASDLSNPSSGQDSSTALTTTTSNGRAPALPFGQVGQSTSPAELKKERNNQFAVHHPNAKTTPGVSLLHTLAHQSVVCCVRFSADGKYLATGCKQAAQIYDAKTGAESCILVHEPSDGGDSHVTSVCFNPSGRLLATGAEDGIVRIWDIARKRIRDSFQGHAQEVYSLVFSWDGRLIVSGSGDRTARIWDVTDGSSMVLKITDVPDNVDAGVISVAISLDGQLVATGGYDTVVRIWDARTGKILGKLREHTDSVYGVAFTPDGRGLVSGSLDKMLKYWDISRLAGGPGGHQTSSGASKGGRSNRVKEVDGNSVGAVDFAGTEDHVLCVAVSHDGQWVVSGSRDRGIRFWDTKTGISKLTFKGHKNSVASIDFSPAGGIFATGSTDREVRVWEYRTTP